jgi:hypothetical protein
MFAHVWSAWPFRCWARQIAAVSPSLILWLILRFIV